MARFLIQHAASYRIDEIYRYTLKQWGSDQAKAYIEGLFASFAEVVTRKIPSRPVPAAFAVSGYFYRDQKHFVYWRYLGSGDVGIVTVLHERMHQIEQFRDDFNVD